jgi:hypothetical protein
MTATILRFNPKNSGTQPTGTPSPLYRHHDYCIDCMGHHAIELTAAMADYVRAIAPQTDGCWADDPPELLKDCHPLPASAVKKNILILSGESVEDLAASIETAFHALLACADRIEREQIAYSTAFGHAFHADSATHSRVIRPGGRSEATLGF